MHSDTMKPSAFNFITVKQAAELLGYHPEHIRELARDGKLPAVKAGARAWLFDPDELLAWRAEHPKRGVRA